MGIWAIIIIVAVIIIISILAAAFLRESDMDYRLGKGLFENSENNLDDKPELSDKEYYDGDGGLLK